MNNRQIKEKLFKKTEISRHCWNWVGNKINGGHGKIFINGKYELTHRVSYLLFIGSIPEGLCVCHSCDNPACVRPSHLWVGSRAENNKDRHLKGRDGDNSGEKNGRAKIDWGIACLIRKDFSSGKYMKKEIAKKYGISPAIVSCVVRNISWVVK